MTKQEVNYYKAAASLDLMPDEENPIFFFNSAHKDLLMDIITGKLDARQLARMEMRNRGLDTTTGKFIGWTTKTTSDVLV